MNNANALAMDEVQETKAADALYLALTSRNKTPKVFHMAPGITAFISSPPAMENDLLVTIFKILTLFMKISSEFLL